jgi:micrococcal nuclease
VYITKNMIFIVLLLLLSSIGFALSKKRVLPKNVSMIFFSLSAIFSLCALITYDEPPINLSLWERNCEECDCVKNTVGQDVFEHSAETDDFHNESVFYSVESFVDGDTIKVDIEGKTETIRMIGMNTPETVDPRSAVECFGKEASQKMRELLEGKRILLKSDLAQGDRDKYGRLLRFVILEDGTNIGEQMILEGYAYEYTYKKPYVYQDLYKNAQKIAQKNKRGLWADGVCE